MDEIKLLERAPLFCADKHVSYIVRLTEQLSSPESFEGALTEHLKMSGVYWALNALSLLTARQTVDELMNTTEIVDWVITCWDEKSGGFAGNTGQDGHILYTLSALQILALTDNLHDPRIQFDRVVRFITSLQQRDGSFVGDAFGEIDTRFTYCAFQSLALLQALHEIDINAAVNYLKRTLNFDGGCGANIGGESHAGQVFCGVAALSIACRLDVIDGDQLGWWLSERQVDSGGLNGRPEKQADVCYSWWILSALSIVGRVSWISGDRLAGYILKCQDGDDGGIADRPDDMPDVFHTFFGVAGLSLLGTLHQGDNINRFSRTIDPVYALPSDIVRTLKLPGQVLIHDELDSRLSFYDRLEEKTR
jgi:geranylgeranyl transferase type-2 subunit beta